MDVLPAFASDSASEAGDGGSGDERTPATSPLPAKGTTELLVMLATWTEPDATEQEIERVVFDEAASFLQEISWGQLSLTGEVTPWLSIGRPATGDPQECRDDLMERARAAAAAQGIEVGAYDAHLVYVPLDDAVDIRCELGRAEGREIWVHGKLDAHTVVHELGHTYGLGHSSYNLCTEGLSGDCQFSEYGDPWGAMGKKMSHFNAAEKTQLGWMGHRLTDLTNGGSATLLPMAAEGDEGIRGVRIETHHRTYWVEHRQPINADARTDDPDGLLIRVTGVGSGKTNGSPSLIDAWPQDGVNWFNAELPPGEAWTSPEGIRIEAGAFAPGSADVTVIVPPQPPVIREFGVGKAGSASVWALGNAFWWGQPNASAVIHYGKTAAMEHSTAPWTVSGAIRSDGTYGGVFMRSIPDLDPGSTYFAAVTLTTAEGSRTSRTKWVALDDIAPSVEQLASGARGETEGWILGSVNLREAQTATLRVDYGPTPALGHTTDTKTLTGTRQQDGSYRASILQLLTGLQPGTRYHGAVTITTEFGHDTRNLATFLTDGTGAPQVLEFGLTLTPDDTALAAVGNVGLGRAEVAHYRIDFGTTSAYGRTVEGSLNGFRQQDGSYTAGVATLLENLEPNTPYHARLVVLSEYGMALSADQVISR